MFRFSLLYAANPPPPGFHLEPPTLPEINLAQIPQTYKDIFYFNFTSVVFSVYY